MMIMDYTSHIHESNVFMLARKGRARSGWTINFNYWYRRISLKVNMNLTEPSESHSPVMGLTYLYLYLLKFHFYLVHAL
jgi:hypothetical protein